MSKLSEKAKQVLRRCEKTASWNGVAIDNLSQRNLLGDTPLHTVCTWGDVQSVVCLVDAGADVNALGDRGCTPLFNAVMSSDPEVVRTLLNAGADSSILSIDGRSVLRYAENVRAPQAIVDLLLQDSNKGKSERPH